MKTKHASNAVIGAMYALALEIVTGSALAILYRVLGGF